MTKQYTIPLITLVAVSVISICGMMMGHRNGEVYSFRMGCNRYEREYLPSYSDMLWNLKVWNFDTYLKPYHDRINSLEIGQIWTDKSDNPFKPSIYRFVILDIKGDYVKYNFGDVTRSGMIELSAKIDEFMYIKIKLD